MQRQRQLWPLSLGIVLLACVGLYFLVASKHYPLRVFQPSPTEDAAPEDTGPDFYEWRTVPSFPAVEPEVATNATLDDLCRYFPKYKLRDIQPVLKTGHGVMNRVRQSLQSTSACLDNLLILSDLDEDVDRFHAIDIIADIPQHLLYSDNQTIPYRELKELAKGGPLDNAALSKVEGWKTDKFKFLPAISRAWRIAPEKRWYVFFEGDTYILWDSVFRLLENFDADKAQYFGSPSPGRNGTWFGNGGPGYILSREAMRRLVKDDWNPRTGEWLGSKLTEKYWNNTLGDCCGDSVLGWVLHLNEVDLKGLWPLFNPHPLEGLPFSDLYWCQPALSMHKSNTTMEIDFWRWEWQARTNLIDSHRAILWRDIAEIFFNITSYTAHRTDWDNGDWDSYPPANDDPNEPHSSSGNCARACENADGCFQWTYHLKQCRYVRSFRIGRAKEPQLEKEHEDEDWSKEDRRYTAGWDTKTIRKWIDDRPCDQVQWVKPSIKRIF